MNKYMKFEKNTEERIQLKTAVILLTFYIMSNKEKEVKL